MQTAMASQAQSLLTAWQPPKMAHQSGTPPSTAKSGSAEGDTKAAGRDGKESKDVETASGPPLIKAGTIFFGVLDTGVDSDYPDTPVMVTIVQGPFKGATLLGKLALAKGQDKVSLTFNLMNRDDW